MDEEQKAKPLGSRENVLVILIFIAVLALLLFTANGAPPFVYGGF